MLDPAKLARAVADGGGPPAVILMTRGAERWERVADQSAALTCAGRGCAKLAGATATGWPIASSISTTTSTITRTTGVTAISTTPSPRLPERRRRASDTDARRATRVQTSDASRDTVHS